MTADGSAPAAGSPAVDAEHPWLGLASFTEESRGYFHGREEEVAELARRVQRKLLTILFGQSGLGKTSILRAGIVPRLRPAGYCPVYVRIDYAPESPPPAEQIKQAVFRATESTGQWTQPGSAVAGESLWEFLHHRDDLLKDAQGRTVVPLLIFDQFEEVFTLAQADDAGRARAAQFLEELADLVENRPPGALEARLDGDDSLVERFDFGRADYRILIALREDYLAHLEGLKGAMPSITQNRMRLAPMTGTQALNAVTKPGGRLVTQEVAEAIVRFIAGGAELRNAEVEPSLLSLICRELNNARLAQGRAEISADLLAGSHETILSEFYERALADQPAAVRKVVEDELLTESGHRESLAEERLAKAFAAAGAAPDAIATLVNRRLLRIEERLDVRRVELTHDVLCGVVKASRALRQAREAREEAERQLAAQREREAATRRALVRARQVAAAAALLAVVAVVGAVFGWVNMKRAQEAEATARQTRELAERARGEAEKLIVYLLDDFYRELEPIGRLDIVADLSKRALDYYDGLPPALRTADTERNRALALVRRGAVARYQARLDEGEKALKEAVGILGGLREKGDAQEITAIGYAMGLTALSKITADLSRYDEAIALVRRAWEVLEPLARAPGASVAVRRAFAAVGNSYGFGQMRTNQSAAAVKTLEAAREAYRGIDGLKMVDLASAAGYAEASAWQMSALQDLGRLAEARELGDEAVRVATAVLDRRPGHMGALRSRALTTSALADIEAESLHLRRSVAYGADATRDWEAYARLDPGNSIGWNNLGASELRAAAALRDLGRTPEALVRLRGVLAIERKAKGALQAFSYNGLVQASGSIAALQAEQGLAREAEASLAEARRLAKVVQKPLAPGSWDARANQGFVTGLEAGVAEGSGDFAGAREKLLTLADELARMKPGNALEKRQALEFSRNIQQNLARLSLLLGDDAAVETYARRAIELGGRIPVRTPADASASTEPPILLAVVLARRGQAAEARALLGPVIKKHRELHAAGSDSLEERLLAAAALYGEALASPAVAPARLAEAAAILDAFTPDMKRRRGVAFLRELVAKAGRGR